VSKLDRENIQALKEIRNLGKAIELATKTITKQEKIKRGAMYRFRELLISYPCAREVYYYGVIQRETRNDQKEKEN